MAHIKTLILVALSLIVIGAVGVLVSLALAGPEAVAPQAWTLDAAEVRRIEIDVANADVDLFPNSQGPIHVRLSGRRTGEQARVAVEGDTLQIQTARPRIFHLFRGSRTLSVELPEQVYVSLQADVHNGDLEAKGLQIAEDPGTPGQWADPASGTPGRSDRFGDRQRQS